MTDRIEVENYFGGCPECGNLDNILNVGRAHWAICKEHRTRWCIGSNLFDSWKTQTKEEQLALAQDVTTPKAICAQDGGRWSRCHRPTPPTTLMTIIIARLWLTLG